CVQGMPVNTCFSDVNPTDPNNPFAADQPDMTSNLMDYAPPACIAVFTPGQAARMRSALEGPRASLLRSSGCDPPCASPVDLQIQWPASPLLFGAPVLITHASQGATAYTWQWYRGPTTEHDLLFPADSIGTFEICLEATGATPACRSR